MNIREKFNSVVNFDKEGQIPNWEFGYWPDAIYRWYDEGLPKINPPDIIDYVQWVHGESDPPQDVFQDILKCYGDDVREYFGFDERVHSAPLKAHSLPLFDEEVYEEDEETTVFKRDYDGKVVKTRKDGTSMPSFLEYPVKSRKDFEKIKERFDPDYPSRTPENFDQIIEEYRNRDYVLQTGGTLFSGFFSILREMMGLESTVIKFFDDPKLIIEMMEFFTDYHIRLNSKVASKVEVDYVYIWEDMSYKNDPLISPAHFKEFILPYYKKFTSAMKEYGVKNFFVDTDGNCTELIPLFIEGGVTGLLPFEVASGMDIEKVRAQYPDLVIMGGLDKVALAKGKDEIRREIKKAEKVLATGGYIPYTDHAVPPEVSFENYKFFREELTRILGK